MRGLTPLERECLLVRVNNGPRVSFPHGHPVWDACDSLFRCGRITRTLEIVSGPPVHSALVSHITDLGRLALRCCPVGEEVSR